MNENYLIIGDDEYIRETEAARLRDKFLSSSEVSLNYSVYSPADSNGVMDSVGTTPFLAEKRVVLVKDAQDISGEFALTLLSYLEKPVPTSVLVLSAEDSFKKNKHYRALSALVNMVKAEKPGPVTIKKWIHAFFKKEGVEIAPGAVDLIVELKGTDTTGVKAELDKLLAFSGGKKVEIEHVEQLVGRSVTETVFKLADAVNARDAGWAFRILGDLYDQKKQPHEIIGYLSWYLRIMQKITLLSGRGIGLDGIASELRYSPGYTRRLMNEAKKYSVEKIEGQLSLLFETDQDIKTGRKPGQLALEMLLVSFLKG
ncbi:DNA polymerase III subunit delta [Candidatus Omnitrophota bacterium]